MGVGPEGEPPPSPTRTERSLGSPGSVAERRSPRVAGLLPIVVLATLLVAGLATHGFSAHGPSARPTPHPGSSPAAPASPSPSAAPSEPPPARMVAPRSYDARGMFFQVAAGWQWQEVSVVGDQQAWVVKAIDDEGDSVSVLPERGVDPKTRSGRTTIAEREAHRSAAPMGTASAVFPGEVAAGPASIFFINNASPSLIGTDFHVGVLVFTSRARYLVGANHPLRRPTQDVDAPRSSTRSV
jgi:hypothetical protein